jgi:hypothetical protein
MASPDVNDEIKNFEIFLRQLEFGQELSNGWTAEAFTLFSRGDFTVILRGQDAEAFGAIVDGLYKAIGRCRAIAKGTVSRFATECVVKVAKVSDPQRSSSFDAVLQTSLQELRSHLFAPEMPWRFVLPIGGLAPSGLPMTVGRVHFRFADQQTIDDLREQARCVHSLRSVPDEANAFSESFNNDLSRFQNCATATVEMNAIDDETARLLALKTLRSTLDCINFYADRNRWGMWAYLYGDTSSVDEPFVTFRMSKEGTPDSYKTGGHRAGPIRCLPLNQLGSLQGFCRISEMLANPNRGSAEDRLLTSIQWTGRAQVDPRPEEAFLLYAISLESLVLGSKRSEELGYRLGLRCAHLVAPPERRRTVTKHLRDLYGMRSKIVHSGKTLVPDADLTLLRGYCRKAIFRVLNDPSFRQLTSDEELEDWFEQQALGNFTPTAGR